MKAMMEEQGVEYNYFEDEVDYKESMQRGMKDIKQFCVQIATAYSIIYLEQSESIPQIKSIVYSHDSKTYYIYGNDENFIMYLLPRLEKFFLNLKTTLSLPNFKIEHDVIDNNNCSIEVKFDDEKTIAIEPSYKSKLISI
jgi:hypothetical protein